MIIRPVSDLHIEFDGLAPWHMPVIEGESEMVLILAGDITANHNRWKDNPARDLYSPWIKDVCGRHKAVIYVPGNHEHYAGHMENVEAHWRGMANHIDNLHFLNRDTVMVDGVRFIGCTMWTELPPTQVTSVMNDFNMIWVDGELFTISDWRQEHEACRYFLDKELEKELEALKAAGKKQVDNSLTKYKRIIDSTSEGYLELDYNLNIVDFKKFSI